MYCNSQDPFNLSEFHDFGMLNRLGFNNEVLLNFPLCNGLFLFDQGNREIMLAEFADDGATDDAPSDDERIEYLLWHGSCNLLATAPIQL